MKLLQRDYFFHESYKKCNTFMFGLFAYFLFELVNMTHQSKRKGENFGLSQILLGML